MRRLILGLLSASLLATVASPQVVERYRDNATGQPQVVDDTHRMPTTNGPSGSAGAGLASTMFQNQGSGLAVSGRLNFYGMTVTAATGQGAGYMMIWDALTVPIDGTVAPFRCFYVDTGPRTTTYGSSVAGVAMATGAAWAFSSGADCQHKVTAPLSFVSLSFKQ